MIRLVLAFVTLALAVCGFIIFAPFGAEETPTDAQVTRAETDATITSLIQEVHPASLATATAPAPMGNSAAAKILAATGGAVQPEQKIKTDNSTLAETSAAVLAALGVQGTETTKVDGGEYQDVTASILAGINGATGKPQQAATPATGLQSLVAQALKEGQSDAYIDALLNEAATAGEVSVPAMLVTSDGKVDTATLLASIVADAQSISGGGAPEVPSVPSGDGTGVEVRVVQTAAETKQYRFYTVGAGDSLGSIAIKFYGSVAHYPRIFDANRQILSSPDRIQAGQRLIIPDLT